MIPDTKNILELWTHIYGTEQGVLCLFSGVRPEPGSKGLQRAHTTYFDWPEEAERARAWIVREAHSEGREAYHCAHLLTGRRRIKENAAPMRALYVDGDGAGVPGHLPPPSVVIESSPGRAQFYWRLSSTVTPDVGEGLNRRLAYAMDADRSGWDLSQLLRPPGTINHKYVDVPEVLLRLCSDVHYVLEELDQVLPPLPEERTLMIRRASRPTKKGASAPELSRFSQRMRNLIRFGNRGEYQSRSEADMAACVALFGAGYALDEVWAVMTDPTNGISEKYFEKGLDGERYLL